MVTGPVWSALDIAVLLVVCGTRIMAADAAGHRPRPGWVGWLGSLLSMALLLTAFLWNHSLVAAGGVPVTFPRSMLGAHHEPSEAGTALNRARVGAGGTVASGEEAAQPGPTKGAQGTRSAPSVKRIRP